MPLSNTNSLPPIAVTLGDPAGIGPELVSKAWARRVEDDLPPFFWLGIPALISDVPTQVVHNVGDVTEIWQNALPILPIDLAEPVAIGTPNPANAKATIAALELSAQLCLNGAAGAVVTAPMAKDVLYAAGFRAPGQTEFYADACRVDREKTAMLLAAPALKVVPVTIHVPLKKVPAQLTHSLIVSRARITHKALRDDFGIYAPRLAFAGLNPHAGEQDQIGDEETTTIVPAIDALKADGIDARGPFAADSLFHAEARATYDVAMTMYHDQGLIPLKTLDFHGGVNVTLGLPIVRTSPDHGTAFDIAGKGMANPRSFISAIKMAGEIAQRRAMQ